MNLANLVNPVDAFSKLSKSNLVWLKRQVGIYASFVSYYHVLTSDQNTGGVN